MDGPPISIFSITAASSAPDRTVWAKGYKLTITASKAFMPKASSWPAWPGFPISASIPAWICGSSVFTRPSRLSGNPVTFSTGVTSTPSSSSRSAVEPVETTSVPAAMNASASVSRPFLSKTETITLCIGRCGSAIMPSLSGFSGTAGFPGISGTSSSLIILLLHPQKIKYILPAYNAERQQP